MTNQLGKVPYQFTSREYQQEFLTAQKRFKLAVWHRRSGKSKTAINLQIARACRTKGVYYYILPTREMAKRICWDELINLHVHSDLYLKKNDSELAIYYKNGSIQRFLGSDDPDSLRGANPVDVVFDEYSEQDPRVWTEVIQPVLRENKGTATFIFTPKGTNHAFNLLQEAKNNPSEWFWSIKGISDTKVFSEAEVDEIKLSTPQSIFDQEYEVKFLDDATQIFKMVERNIHDLTLFPDPIHKYVIGVDLAKSQDFTVITVLDLMSFNVVEIERFNQIDWVLQKTKIELYKHKYFNPLFRIDATGLGDPIYDDLVKAGLNVDGFKFTERSKFDLITNLMVYLEQQRIKFPRYQILIDELKSFRYELKSTTRKIKMSVPTNNHDDTVMSLALAVWQLPLKPMVIDLGNEFNLKRLLGSQQNVQFSNDYY